MDSFTLFRKSGSRRGLGHGALCLAIVAGSFLAQSDVLAGKGTSGSALLAPPAVSITGQPQGTTVCDGQDATLTVSATGSPQSTLHYQWRKGQQNLTEGAKYVGTQTATLTIRNFSAADISSNYNVVIIAESNPVTTPPTLSNPVISENVTINVRLATLITRQIVESNPLDTGFCAGGPFTLSVTAQGATSFQWYKDNAIIPNETKSAITIMDPGASTAGNYYVKVFGECGMDSSKVANVRAYSATAITTEPVDVSICEGSTLSLGDAVAASGENITYSWSKVGLTNPVGTSKVYTKTAVLGDSGTYRLTVMGTCGQVVSRDVRVSTKARPRFISDITPGTGVIRAGQSARLAVKATGSGTLTYTWKRDGVTVSGATSDTLKIDSFSAADAGEYVVTVSNECGDTTSKRYSLRLSSMDEIAQNGYALMLAQPNPVSDNSTISFRVPVAQRARLAITDLTGREVAVLFDGMAAGEQITTVPVNAQLAPGMYFYTLTAGSFQATQTITVVR